MSRTTSYRYNNRNKTLLEYVLLGLVPYTRENHMLAFTPHAFFNELEHMTGCNRHALQSAYYRAKRLGYITKNSAVPSLTREGQRAVLPFQATKLGAGACLIVMFDIPQDQAVRRQNFRRILKNLGFSLVQQSVWMSEMDYRVELVGIINDLGIGEYVEVHESLRLFPRK